MLSARLRAHVQDHRMPSVHLVVDVLKLRDACFGSGEFRPGIRELTLVGTLHGFGRPARSVPEFGRRVQRAHRNGRGVGIAVAQAGTALLLAFIKKALVVFQGHARGGLGLRRTQGQQGKRQNESKKQSRESTKLREASALCVLHLNPFEKMRLHKDSV